jgi:hypothetical protein
MLLNRYSRTEEKRKPSPHTLKTKKMTLTNAHTPPQHTKNNFFISFFWKMSQKSFKYESQEMIFLYSQKMTSETPLIHSKHTFLDEIDLEKRKSLKSLKNVFFRAIT